MLTLWQDIRYAFRQLAKSPGFSCVALLTLALGIGANACIFSVLYGILLRPLPYGNPEELVWISGGTVTDKKVPIGISAADFVDYRAQTKTFRHLSAVTYSSASMILTGAGEAVQLEAFRVSAGFFETLRIQPIHGRTFRLEEESKGRERVVVLSYRLWQRLFGSDPSAVGKSLTLNALSYEVVGIMPPGFEYPVQAEIWTPIVFGVGMAARRDAPYWLALGRLAPGFTLEQAQAEFDTIAATLEKAYPGIDRGYKPRLVSLAQHEVGDVRPTLAMLASAVGFILLIACANVANLLLARAAGRRREIAIRVALGSRPWRILRQLLTESVVLALAGGALGTALAFAGVEVLKTLPGAALPRLTEVRVDLPVLGFTIALSIATGILFGLAPALEQLRGPTAEALKEGGRGAAEGFRRNRTRSLLVVGEVSLALVLLIGAALLLASFQRLISVEPGFRADGVSTMQLRLPVQRYKTSAEGMAFFERYLERIKSIQGVQAVGATWALPLGGTYSFAEFVIEGELVPAVKPLAGNSGVTPGYFEAMRIALKRGRYFDSRDRAGTPPVMLISEPMAKRYFPNQDPIGRRVTVTYVEPYTAEIVGIVEGVRHGGMADEPRAEFYVCLLQRPHGALDLVVRSTLDIGTLAGVLKRELKAMDPGLPLHNLRSMDKVIAESVAQPRLRSLLTGTFAVTALLLASLGIYGVISYSVSRRTQEIGLRMALGADPGQVLRMILLYGLRLTMVGVGIGIVAGATLSQLLGSLLYGISATNPVVYAGVSVMLMAVALLASWLPARRATRVDPVEALRME